MSGGPSLATRVMADRLEEFRLRHDYLRHALVNEPRGSEVIVGALLCEPANSGTVAGVFYFNNVGYLGMCVHGTIGLVVTLAHLGKIEVGEHKIDTPVGTVTATFTIRARSAWRTSQVSGLRSTSVCTCPAMGWCTVTSRGVATGFFS